MPQLDLKQFLEDFDRDLLCAKGLAVDQLVNAEISESPCGGNVGVTGRFDALVRLATPKRNFIINPEDDKEPKEPEWRKVATEAVTLLKGTKEFEGTRDLRIAVYLTSALVKLCGYAGLRDGLELLHGYLDGYWECVHPQLDPENNNDPDTRIIAIQGLCPNPQGMNPIVTAADAIIRAPFVGTPGKPDAISLQFVEANKDKLDNAFKNVSTEKLETANSLLSNCKEHVRAILQLFQTNANRQPNLEILESRLDTALRLISKQIEMRLKSTVPDDPKLKTEQYKTKPFAQVESFEGQISNSKQVSIALEEICKYYRDKEPSSPIPILLERAQELIDKSFTEIIEELTPKGMEDVKRLKKKEDKKN
jgi:type VI secretion system protein ImpA